MYCASRQSLSFFGYNPLNCRECRIRLGGFNSEPVQIARIFRRCTAENRNCGVRCITVARVDPCLENGQRRVQPDANEPDLGNLHRDSDSAAQHWVEERRIEDDRVATSRNGAGLLHQHIGYCRVGAF